MPLGTAGMLPRIDVRHLLPDELFDRYSRLKDRHQPARPVAGIAMGDATGSGLALVFSSPCCGAPELVDPWMVEHARKRGDGGLWIECGRHRADPLRTPQACHTGCGQRFRAIVEPAPPIRVRV